MHTVRLTIRPDDEITVGDAEYTDLKRQGLILAPESAAEPTERPEPSATPQNTPPVATGTTSTPQGAVSAEPGDGKTSSSSKSAREK